MMIYQRHHPLAVLVLAVPLATMALPAPAFEAPTVALPGETRATRRAQLPPAPEVVRAQRAYNVVWTEPSDNASESMPCGGGDIGLNVWVEDGELLLYMQRSGSLAENNEYLKLGRVRLRLDPNPFGEKEADFRQELKLREGYVEIEGIAPRENGESLKATVRIWVEIARPIIHVEVDANRSVNATACYESWRLTDEMVPNNARRRSCFTLDKYPGEVPLSKDTVDHVDEGILFYHRNPKDTIVDMLIEQQGLDKYKNVILNDLRHRTFGGLMTGDGFQPAGTAEGKYQTTPFRASCLKTERPARRHHVRIVTHIAQTETLAKWRGGLQSMVRESADDRDAARHQARAWWDGFWNRSWILINPERPDASDRAWRVGRNYNLFRYQLGCNVSGEYPSKFNGGNFTYDANLVGGRGGSFGPDWRDWGGGVHTAQNQRLLYWPILKAGDFDAVLPQFELYRKALPGSRARVRRHFQHDGAVYSEYISATGLALGCGWGWESGPRARGTEIPFGDPRADAARGYNDLVERGVMANRAISYHWESQLEHAYMILQYRRFTGADIGKYLPFIENAVVFFDQHYRKREQMRSGRELDEQGHLVIYPSTSCESYRGARNPSDVIAGLRACIEGILALPEGSLELRDKDYYRTVLASIPPYSYDTVEGDRIIKPAASWKRYQNVECPQFYPLFPFDRFDLLGGDDDHLDIFRNTWKHGRFRKGLVISWHQDGIFFARMGLTDAAVDFNSRKLDDSPRRFPTFWGPGHDWVPDHNWGGSGMIGLQEMLMQTIGDEIRLLPAWPSEWNVDFRLHAPRQTIVTGQVRDGKIVDLVVRPESRAKDVVVHGGKPTK